MSDNVGKFFIAANDREERVCVIAQELDDYLLILSSDEDEGKWIPTKQWQQLEARLKEGPVPSKKLREIVGEKGRRIPRLLRRDKDFTHLDANQGGRLNAKTIESEVDGHQSIRLDWNSISSLTNLSN